MVAYLILLITFLTIRGYYFTLFFTVNMYILNNMAAQMSLTGERGGGAGGGASMSGEPRGQSDGDTRHVHSRSTRCQLYSYLDSYRPSDRTGTGSMTDT